MSEDAGFILLAAGLSTRFGRNKLFASLDGEQALIMQTAKNILYASHKLLVVGNASHYALNALLDKEGIPHLSTPSQTSAWGTAWLLGYNSVQAGPAGSSA